MEPKPLPASSLLKPVDLFLEQSIAGLRRAHLYEPIKALAYKTALGVAKTHYSTLHRLRIWGQEYVPAQGGCILACNHRSWLDAQIISLAGPRKVSFLTRSEFSRTPVLRHILQAADAVFLRRGDDENLAAIAELLREGLVLGVFPEGTIPGEEDMPRWEVDPETGLLPGRSGAVRLALMAHVPIIPVGISGTDSLLPPEVWPRLSRLTFPKPTTITVRFGEPIRLEKRHDEEINYEQLRGMTHRVMTAISRMVEPAGERMNNPTAPCPPIAYQNTPVKEKQRYGVLALHGFTSHVACVADLRFALDEMNVPYRIPVLRGHGTKWEDLQGVTAQDWFADAEAAMQDLLTECRKVFVVGLSMGGLVTLELAMRHPKDVVGITTVAAALRFQDKLAFMSPVMAKLLSSWPSPSAYHDKSLEQQRNRNYPRFATGAFVELYKYSKRIEQDLTFVHCPALILHSRKDQVIHPDAAQAIHDKISSTSKKLVWFERSGHEMMLDMESEAVVSTIAEWLKLQMAQPVTDD